VEEPFLLAFQRTWG